MNSEKIPIIHVLFERNFIQRGSLFQIIAPVMLLLLCANAMLVPNLGWTKEDESSLGDGGCSGVEPCLMVTFYFLSDHESETRHGKRPEQSSVFVRVCLWSACSGVVTATLTLVRSFWKVGSLWNFPCPFPSGVLQLLRKVLSLRFSSCVSLASYQCTSTSFFGFASLEDVQQQKFHFLKKIEL